MNKTIELFVDLTDREFDGQSFNGPSLMRTLRSLSLEQAVAKKTHEDYKAWSIVLHLGYWKQFLAVQLSGKDGAVSPVPHEEKDWPSLPPELSLEAVHRFYMDALRSFPPDRLDEELEAWECPFGIAWMATHDTYHVAQIRNMGLENLTIEQASQ